jgi:putative Mn2+ efflux pump MntP
MDFFSVLLIAFGLSMDAVAVSVAAGLTLSRQNRAIAPTAFRGALTFGAFQAVMPLIGYAAGSLFSGWLAAVDHWVAFALLAFIGGKMIYESRQVEEELENEVLQGKELVVAAVATSIDALAVGVTLAMFGGSVFAAAALIGLVTFLFCLPAFFLGSRLGAHFESHAEMVGGVVLVSIGLKILVQHLV